MIQLLYFLGSILLLFAANDAEPDRLYGAEIVAKGELPFYAQIELTENAKPRVCGATLIHSMWVLTAAVCFDAVENEIEHLTKENRLKVYIGSNLRLGDDAQINYVEDIFFHPEYHVEHNSSTTGLRKNNIAAAELKKAYPLTGDIDIALLPPPAVIGRPWTSRCEFGLVMGLRTSHSKRSKNLLYANVHSKIRNEVNTSSTGEGLNTVFYTEIQWLEGYPFEGNPGEPFICYFESEPVLYGILSTREDPTSEGSFIDVYEEVDKHIQFILDIVPGQIFKTRIRLDMHKSIASRPNRAAINLFFHVFNSMYILKKLAR